MTNDPITVDLSRLELRLSHLLLLLVKTTREFFANLNNTNNKTNDVFFIFNTTVQLHIY